MHVFFFRILKLVFVTFGIFNLDFFSSHKTTQVYRVCTLSLKKSEGTLFFAFCDAWFLLQYSRFLVGTLLSPTFHFFKEKLRDIVFGFPGCVVPDL